jgi:hypothetical protein
MPCSSNYSKLKNTYSAEYKENFIHFNDVQKIKETYIENFDDTKNLGVALTNWYSNINAITFLESMINRYKNKNMITEENKTDKILNQTKDKNLEQIKQIKDIISKDENYVKDYLAYISKQQNPDEKLKTIKEFLYSQLGN